MDVPPSPPNGSSPASRITRRAHRRCFDGYSLLPGIRRRPMGSCGCRRAHNDVYGRDPYHPLAGGSEPFDHGASSSRLPVGAEPRWSGCPDAVCRCHGVESVPPREEISHEMVLRKEVENKPVENGFKPFPTKHFTCSLQAGASRLRENEFPAACHIWIYLPDRRSNRI